ncbi:MAG: tetratricopeptide repeat protein [Planctomycetota bacterium]|nr:tetratricopeptide repeat protein [Planctomycetota bacterium]MDA1248733.1 tetratricopeptide repeat protein [Planctomycetota bacterium]
MKRSLLNATFFKAASLTLTLLVASHAQAQTIDTINRKSVKPQKGTITGITRDEVKIKPGISAEVSVPANDIVDVEWGGAPGALNLGRGAENAGNFAVALERYTEAAAEAGSSANVKMDIQFLIARVTAKTAMEQDASKLDDAAAKLDAFVKANVTSFRFFDAVQLLGQVQLAREDFTQAETAFNRLAQAPWSDYKMAGQNAAGRLAIARGDFPGALKSYDAVLVQPATSAAEISRRNEALLGKSAVLIEQKNHAVALTTITEAISKADPEDSAVQAEAYILKGECLKALGQTKEAILAYLHVPVLFEKEAMLNAQALYNLATLWDKVEQPERGLAARTELTEKYAESKWAKMLQ